MGTSEMIDDKYVLILIYIVYVSVVAYFLR